MFAATFLSNCPRKWSQLLRYCPFTRGPTHPTLFGLFVQGREGIRTKKGFERKKVKEQKQKQLNRVVIVSKDADQLQGCSQEVGRNNWKEVL